MHLNHAVNQALLPSADVWELRQGWSWESHGEASREWELPPDWHWGFAGAAAVM